MQGPAEEAEASIPAENVKDGSPNLNQYRTSTVSRKATKRREPWYNNPAPPLP